MRKLILAASLAALFAAPAHAIWPERPIRVVVPFAPGGTSDIIARNLQRVIQEQNMLPQPLTILNVTGHFSVGATQVKNATPDGYTFLLLHIALLAGEIVDPRRNLSYRDFAPVALTGGFCLHPIVRADSPHRTLTDVLTAARDRPGTILFGVNIGAINHMAGVFMEQTFPGARFRFVQIGGGAENYAALTGNQTAFAVISSSEYQNFRSGPIRALGYTGPERLAATPDLPTMREQGLAFDFCVNNYWFAPRGTPAEAIDGMANALQRAMASDAMRAIQAQQASTTEFLRGEAFARNLEATFRAIEPIARASMPPQAQPAPAAPAPAQNR